MKRSLFLSIAGAILLFIGIFYNMAPEKMLGGAQYEVSIWTVSFARTSGIFIGCFGLLSLLARHAEDTAALRAILIATAVMILLTAAFDTWFRVTVAPVKNTPSVILRIVLLAVYCYYLWQSYRAKPQ